MNTKYIKYIDHTILKPDASEAEIINLCNEAKQYNFASVCVNPFFVKLVAKQLENCAIKVCSVIGFPLGQNTIETKCFETKDAIKNGANEIDMVINISKLKASDSKYCLKEINKIKAICGKKIILKVIIEACLLNQQELEFITNIILKSKADFIKTSTGFSFAGAKVEDIKLFKQILKNKKLIKASGGIKTLSQMEALIEAGASRIGTSSAVQIINS